jgi:hypothetical protein
MGGMGEGLYSSQSGNSFDRDSDVYAPQPKELRMSFERKPKDGGGSNGFLSILNRWSILPGKEH